MIFYEHSIICLMQMFIEGNDDVTRSNSIWKEAPVICFQNSSSEDLALSKVTNLS